MAKRVINKPEDWVTMLDIVKAAQEKELPVTLILKNSNQTVDGYVKCYEGAIWLKAQHGNDKDFDSITEYDSIASITMSSPKGTITDLDE